MNYIERLSNKIKSELPKDVLPEVEYVDDLFYIYAVLSLAKKADVTLEDVHDAWAAWMTQHDPSHASIKPYSELSPDVRKQDEPFLAAIKRALG